MKNSMENANKITLNLIQKELNISVCKPVFLKMIFPESLQKDDSEALLDFIFNADSSYQSSRTSFFNGNIYKKGSTYSRAHQTELHFIAKQLNTTSVFKEMVDLLSNNFSISMKHKVFTLLLLDENIYPHKFKNTVDAYRNTNEPYKLLALMILWSIYGEWITLLSLEFRNNTTLEEVHTDSTLRYFKSMLAQAEHIESIDFAFQSGALWLTHAARTNQLIELIRHDVHIHVIIAAYDPSEHISQHMHHSESFFAAVQTMWNIFALKYPAHVKVRVSPTPLMHNYYCFHMDNPSQNIMRLNFYTHHNAYIDKNPTLFYDVSSEFYNLFNDEFSYLWSISKDIGEFIDDNHFNNIPSEQEDTAGRQMTK